MGQTNDQHFSKQKNASSHNVESVTIFTRKRVSKPSFSIQKDNIPFIQLVIH